MVSVIVVLIGLVSLTRIQVDLLPEIELPTLTVRTEYPGHGGDDLLHHLGDRLFHDLRARPG
ncbi:MAG: hypothetical protein AAFX94_08655, partial [Myxococcota bacterium]